MLELINKWFENRKTEKKKKLFKKTAENHGYSRIFDYKESGKMSFNNGEMLIVVSLQNGDVVSTKGTRKLKRYGLTDEEVVQVIEDPKIKLDKKFEWIEVTTPKKSGENIQKTQTIL